MIGRGGPPSLHMPKPTRSRLYSSFLSTTWGAALLLFPTALHSQQVARDSLSSFPADTHQMTCANLAQLRSLPDYPRIRQRIFNQQLSNLQDFLRSMGTDPEKDVDEVMLGWRGEPANTSSFFGLAEGRFQRDQIHESFVRSQLPIRHYEGVELYAFGSGDDPADLFFTFLSSSLAAFGRLSDLKALLEVRAGGRPALDSNAIFVNGEAELEGTAPQWGIATGKAAAHLAAPWLASGGKLPVDPSAFLGFVQAVLYRVEWDSGFTAKLSILCENSENASALAQVLNFLRASPKLATGSAPPGVASLLQNMEIHESGSRVELSASGPVETLDQVFQAPSSPTSP